MLASLAGNAIVHGTSLRQLSSPKELRFELNPSVKQYVSQAEKNFDDLVSKHELLVGVTFHFDI